MKAGIFNYLCKRNSKKNDNEDSSLIATTFRLCQIGMGRRADHPGNLRHTDLRHHRHHHDRDEKHVVAERPEQDGNRQPEGEQLLHGSGGGHPQRHSRSGESHQHPRQDLRRAEDAAGAQPPHHRVGSSLRAQLLPRKRRDVLTLRLHEGRHHSDQAAGNQRVQLLRDGVVPDTQAAQ